MTRICMTRKHNNDAVTSVKINHKIPTILRGRTENEVIL